MDNFELIRPPKTRAGCQNDPGFCLALTCKFHFIHFFEPHLDPLKTLLKDKSNEKIADWLIALPESCVLDILDRCGNTTLETIGVVGFITRERVRQVEAKSLTKLRRGWRAKIIEDYSDDCSGMEFIEEYPLPANNYNRGITI